VNGAAADGWGGLEAALAAIAAGGQGPLTAAFLVFLRVGAAMALLPAFGEATVPMRVRLALALAFSAVVAPAVMPALATAGPAAAAGEVVAGLLIGLALRLAVMALQIAGTMAAQATSLSQFFGGAGADPQPALTQLLLMAGLALAVASGLHVRVAAALVASYDVLPPGPPVAAWQAAEWGVGRIGQAFALAFALAAPFTVAGLVYNLALGVINRAMPQLMVAFVGAPALTLGGLALMALALPAILAVWSGAVAPILAAPLEAMP